MVAYMDMKDRTTAMFDFTNFEGFGHPRVILEMFFFFFPLDWNRIFNKLQPHNCLS